MILTAFNGLCMAVADSVPGVSGGTIAFILGFYDRFIDALHNLFGKEKEARKKAALYLLKLGVALRSSSPWGPGLATASVMWYYDPDMVINVQCAAQGRRPSPDICGREKAELIPSA